MKRVLLITGGLALAIFAYVTIGLLIVHHRSGAEFSYRNAGTDLTFTSSDGGWSGAEDLLRGKHFEQVVLAHELYKLNCQRYDSKLLRTKPRKRPWNWAYWFDDYEESKWRVPFAEPGAITTAPCESVAPDAAKIARAARAAARYLDSLAPSK